jgi:hypothetical protein
MAATDLFLVASHVHFLDDTGLNLGSTCSLSSPSHHNHEGGEEGEEINTAEAVEGDTLEPQDDVFYLSRLNDPTTYFFQWICKRYGLTVKSEPHSCPICLETSGNNIQLSCGEFLTAV